MFFSPKINKNREEGRREGEVEMEVGRKGREKEAETRREGKQGEGQRRVPVSSMLPYGAAAPSQLPAAGPPWKPLLCWVANSTEQRGVTSQRTR